MADRITSDRVYSGTVNFTGTVNMPSTFELPAASVVQRYRQSYSQANATATTETRVIHVARGATGTVKSFRAGSIVANIGAATVTIDLKKNNVSVLSAVITLDSGNTARVPEAGTITSAAYSVDDWFEIVITATAGGGTLATGLYVEAEFEEDAE